MLGGPILSRAEVMKDDLLVPGRWIVGNISGSIAWTQKLQRLHFRGAELFVLPVMTDGCPAVAVRVENGMSDEDARRLIMAFLSSLCWVEQQGVLVEEWSGGGLPYGMTPRTRLPTTRREFDFSYLPEPEGADARLGLALYREGRALNHAAYAFLSYFRVIERRCHTGKRIIAWINDHLDGLHPNRHHVANEVLANLRVAHADVGSYLYTSGRCAIAHARQAPLIDPDDPSDLWRLRQELPLMEALAECLIEVEFGVQTLSTIYREHLYELAGFKAALGAEFVGAVLEGRPPREGTSVDLPLMNVQLRGKDPYLPLQRLRFAEILLVEKTLELTLRSANQLVMFRVILDLENERLDFKVVSVVPHPPSRG